MIQYRTDDYELSESGKQIICNAIQRIKKSLDTFQFTIQDRVTPITESELKRVDNSLHSIKELLDNERNIARLYYLHCVENDDVVEHAPWR